MKEISRQDIDKLKEIFGPLSQLKVDGVSYIFRTLTRRDLALVKIFEEDAITPEKEEAIFKIAVIYPQDIDLDSLPAGVVSSITESVLDKSGVLSIDSLENSLLKARQRRTVFTQIYEMICAAFPSIVPSELDGLTIDKLMDLLVMAEGILMIKDLVQEEISFTSNDGENYEEQDKDSTAARLQNALEQAQEQGYI